MRAMSIKRPGYFRAAAILITGLAGLFLSAAPAGADADAEREAVARLIHELKSLESLIERAESEADPDARVKLRYDWLRADLERIREALREHIDAPRAEPRTFPPLRGDYRR